MADTLVLMDANWDHSAGGDRGIPQSGLEERYYIIQNPDHSVMAMVGARMGDVLGFAYGQNGAIDHGAGWMGSLIDVGYKGSWYSKATGLYEMRQGWYDPGSGRNMSPDPNAYWDARNAYFQQQGQRFADEAASYNRLADGIRMVGGLAAGILTGGAGFLAFDSIMAGSMRYQDGQGLVASALGGMSDATGWSGMHAAIWNTDVITREGCNMDLGQRVMTGAFSLLQMGMSVFALGQTGILNAPRSAMVRALEESTQGMTSAPEGIARAPWTTRFKNVLAELYYDEAGSMPRQSFVPGAYLPGMGKYRAVGGHHPLSGRAFDYDFYYDSMAIGGDQLSALGVGHPQPLSMYQQLEYLSFAETGEPLTLTRMTGIEVEAMVKAGIPREYAMQAASRAFWEKLANGQFTPQRIPWRGPNPGVK